MWGGQLCLAVKDGSPHYLFENKGNLYNGRGFEMLAALSQYCCPDLVANAFTSLLSLFNNVQGNDKPILEYWSCFDRVIMDLSQCKVTIPQILLVMLFLWALHSRYSNLLEQFCTRFKLIEHATIYSIIDNGRYHDEFTIHEHKGAKPPTSAHCVPTAASANTDQKGNVWQTPFEWLSKSFSKNQSRFDGLVHSREQASALSATVRTSIGTSIPIDLFSRNSILSWKYSLQVLRCSPQHSSLLMCPRLPLLLMGGVLWWQMSLWLVVPLTPAMLPLVCWHQHPFLCLTL
jgi:hypothetical protein